MSLGNCVLVLKIAEFMIFNMTNGNYLPIGMSILCMSHRMKNISLLEKKGRNIRSLLENRICCGPENAFYEPKRIGAALFSVHDEMLRNVRIL